MKHINAEFERIQADLMAEFSAILNGADMDEAAKSELAMNINAMMNESFQSVNPNFPTVSFTDAPQQAITKEDETHQTLTQNACTTDTSDDFEKGQQQLTSTPRILSNDILGCIFRFLPPKTISSNVALVSKQFKTVSDLGWYYRLLPQFRPSTDDAKCKFIYFNNPNARVNPEYLINLLYRCAPPWQNQMRKDWGADGDPGMKAVSLKFLGLSNFSELDLSRDTEEAMLIIKFNRDISLTSKVSAFGASHFPSNLIKSSNNLPLIKFIEEEMKIKLWDNTSILKAICEPEIFQYLIERYSDAAHDINSINLVLEELKFNLPYCKGDMYDIAYKALDTLTELKAAAESQPAAKIEC